MSSFLPEQDENRPATNTTSINSALKDSTIRKTSTSSENPFALLLDAKQDIQPTKSVPVPISTVNMAEEKVAATTSTPAKLMKGNSTNFSTPKSNVSTFKMSSSLSKSKSLNKKALESLRGTAPSTPRSPGSVSGSIAGSMSSIGSASASRELARAAKEQNTKDRIQKVKELKEKWAQEKEGKLHERAHKQSDSMKLQEISTKLAQQRKINIDKQRHYQQSVKEAEREALVVYSKDRQHSKQEMERINKEKKRFSICLRQELQTKFKQAEEKLLSESKEYDQGLFESRRLDAMVIRDMRKSEDERRRVSMLFRTEMAQKQKMIENLRLENEKDVERSQFQMRYLNWQDEQKHKALLEEQRRESLQKRNEVWSKQKQTELEMQYDDKEREVSLLQSRYEDWKDIEAYKKDQEKRHRESLQGRWLKYRQDRSIEDQLRLQEEEMMEYEIEIKRQTYEDVAKYVQNQKNMKRVSLAYRLEKAKKDRDFDKGKQDLNKWLDIEEQRLRQQDRLDVEEYYKKIENARRVSLEYRNQLEAQERLRLEGVKQAEYDKEATDRELSYLAWKDVQKYHEELREERRQSLAQRLVEARKQKQVLLEAHREKLDELHNELAAQRQDAISTNEAIEDQKKRRRLSLALRLDSWREQRLAEEKLREKKRMIEEENMRYRLEDWQDLQKYKEQLKLEEMKNLLDRMVF